MDDRSVITRFVAVNFGLGALLGFAFVAALMAFDVANLRSIVSTTEGGAVAVLLLLTGFMSLASGALLSTALEHTDEPQHGMPIPVRVAARSRRRPTFS
jgi:hypothetical protein